MTYIKQYMNYGDHNQARRRPRGSRGPDPPPPAAARTTCEIRVDPVRLRWCV